jgi:FlaA1/EpsC-like NDP-sugar epimerase
MNHDKKSGYARFAAMIVTSTVVMYGLMYLNTYELSHVRWSETRVYMALIMGAVMAVIMLSFMRGMFSDKKINLAIYLGSVVVFAGALFLVRSQTTVQDSSYMRAMIPHHSIAILASERADIRDMRVRQLADEIIEAQRREIMEMDWLLEDIREHGIASTEAEAEARPIPDFEVEP